jgi:hypothetical protein
MINTFIARITMLNQYDADKKTLLWTDDTVLRWANMYGKLQENDNAIFIAPDKLLVGKVKIINHEQSLQVSNVEEVECSNDQLLQLNEMYPELIPRAKAKTKPFIHPKEINIVSLLSDLKAGRFVSYYIIVNSEKYQQLQLQSIFKQNDRIVLLDSNNQFENVKLYSNNRLIEFPIQETEIKISVIGMTLDECLKKNEAIKRKSVNSNNVSRIKKIKDEIASNGYYKFKSFSSYHDALFNKKVYNDTGASYNSIQLITLEENEAVYKVSMSGKTGEIGKDAFDYFLENELVVVNKKTKAKATSRLPQGDIFATKMKNDDYFYLCRGNDNFELIGRIIGEAEECEYGSLGDEGWIQRPFEVVAEATSVMSTLNSRIKSQQLYTGIFLGKLPVNFCIHIISMFLPCNSLLDYCC